MNAPPDRSREAPASQSYPLLDARRKYVGAFCTEDEIRIAEHLREFVDRELMPYRQDKDMELMGAAGYAYESQVEKYMRDYKILKMAPGGAQRDLLEIAQGLYGPYPRTGG